MKRFLKSASVCLAAAAMIGCGRSPESEAPSTDAAASPTKAPHNSYSLQWVSHNVPATMAPGASVPIKVSVKNTGDWPWPDPFAGNPSHPDGAYAVRMTCGWADASGKSIQPQTNRGDLTAPVPPGQTTNFTMNITAPKQSGSYQLQIDLVEELVTFFSGKGTEKLVVPVTVQ
jgi:hypothetical protein